MPRAKGSVFDPGADTPQFASVGAFTDTEGLLASLDVANASTARQRAAIAEAFTIASLRPLLDRLAPALRRRGLLD